jgi:hypothetical protein
MKTDLRTFFRVVSTATFCLLLPKISAQPLDRGIVNAREDARRMEALLDQTAMEVLPVLTKLSLEGSSNIPGIGTLPTAVRESAAAIKSGIRTFELTKAFSEADLRAIAQKTGELTAAILGSTNPSVRTAAAVTSIAMKILQLQEILARVQMYSIRTIELKLRVRELEQKQSEMAARQREIESLKRNRDWWVRIQQGLRESSVAHDRWLTNQGVAKTDLLMSALADAKSMGPSGSFQFATGVVILDPDYDISAIERMPGLNPDFIAALRKERSLLLQGGIDAVAAAGPVDKYPGGAYIPAFGPSGPASELGEPAEAEKRAPSTQSSQNPPTPGGACAALESCDQSCQSLPETETFRVFGISMQKFPRSSCGADCYAKFNRACTEERWKLRR